MARSSGSRRRAGSRCACTAWPTGSRTRRSSGRDRQSPMHSIAAGQPTKAATGFAASCGVGVEELQQVDGPKGRVLMFVGTKKGEPTAALLPGIVKAALDALPIAKRMRWGAGEQEFVRPVHWAVMLFGTVVVDCEILGVRTGKHSRGHRFHAPAPLPIASPAKYVEALREGSRRGRRRRTARAHPQRSAGARKGERRPRSHRRRAAR